MRRPGVSGDAGVGEPALDVMVERCRAERGCRAACLWANERLDEDRIGIPAPRGSSSLTFNGTIIETGTTSYRLTHARQQHAAS